VRPELVGETPASAITTHLPAIPLDEESEPVSSGLSRAE
jgi:hypothetical protein